MQWEEKWNAMMSELGEDAEISDLRSMSALLDMCAMMMKLVEICENCENLRAKVVSHTSNEEDRKRCMCRWKLTVLVAANQKRNVREDVDEVRRGSMCYNCGMMGHIARY